ncbi:ribosome small subunit-dependent GTPase A [Novosphingobium aquimarinum]|uniref:ribosome small subunit-dependent GTPase A n=1 Tax=Novosphingobium aquimarinum TaxID=2682494 RepID=UPI0012EC6712|nr:ribosome small subunit-dependent GTPase A [Novosphingobium aquimarinum]
MEASNLTLSELGWTPFFSAQLAAEESRRYCPVRVMAVHRGMVDVQGEAIDTSITSVLPTEGGPEDRPTVGDWLLIERESRDLVRILDRQNLFKRPQPGDDRRVQLIAANVDTLFIVTSCNQDFSIARIERYLVLAREIQVNPVVVLTKVDLAQDPERFLREVRDLQPDLEVEMINGRDPRSVARLATRCATGETVALVGSSGVGESTMINTLRGSDSIATQAVREADGKGRHTTTVREMHRLTGGGWLVDTPGMRELQLSDASAGLAEVFDDIEALTLECRFTNCTHDTEPDCAIQAALADGSLDAHRFERWRRLIAEESVNTGKMTARHTRPAKPGRRN